MTDPFGSERRRGARRQKITFTSYFNKPQYQMDQKAATSMGDNKVPRHLDPSTNPRLQLQRLNLKFWNRVKSSEASSKSFKASSSSGTKEQPGGAEMPSFCPGDHCAVVPEISKKIQQDELEHWTLVKRNMKLTLGATKYEMRFRPWNCDFPLVPFKDVAEFCLEAEQLNAKPKTAPTCSTSHRLCPEGHDRTVVPRIGYMGKCSGMHWNWQVDLRSDNREAKPAPRLCFDCDQRIRTLRRLAHGSVVRDSSLEEGEGEEDGDGGQTGAQQMSGRMAEQYEERERRAPGRAFPHSMLHVMMDCRRRAARSTAGAVEVMLKEVPLCPNCWNVLMRSRQAKRRVNQLTLRRQGVDFPDFGIPWADNRPIWVKEAQRQRAAGATEDGHTRPWTACGSRAREVLKERKGVTFQLSPPRHDRSVLSPTARSGDLSTFGNRFGSSYPTDDRSPSSLDGSPIRSLKHTTDRNRRGASSRGTATRRSRPASSAAPSRPATALDRRRQSGVNLAGTPAYSLTTITRTDASPWLKQAVQERLDIEREFRENAEADAKREQEATTRRMSLLRECRRMSAQLGSPMSRIPIAAITARQPPEPTKSSANLQISSGATTARTALRGSATAARAAERMQSGPGKKKKGGDKDREETLEITEMLEKLKGQRAEDAEALWMSFPVDRPFVENPSGKDWEDSNIPPPTQLADFSRDTSSTSSDSQRPPPFNVVSQAAAIKQQGEPVEVYSQTDPVACSIPLALISPPPCESEESSETTISSFVELPEDRRSSASGSSEGGSAMPVTPTPRSSPSGPRKTLTQSSFNASFHRALSSFKKKVKPLDAALYKIDKMRKHINNQHQKHTKAFPPPPSRRGKAKGGKEQREADDLEARQKVAALPKRHRFTRLLGLPDDPRPPPPPPPPIRLTYPEQ